MELADIGRIARELDRVRETKPRGLLRWTLDGRLIARQLDADNIVIRSGFAEREALLAAHPETFFVPPRIEAHMMIVARLSGGDARAVKAALHAAWDLQSNHD